VPFGVFVSLVEPGAIETNFDQTSEQHSGVILTNTASPYRALYATAERVSASMRKKRISPDTVARVVQRAIEDRPPKPRYLAGLGLSSVLVLRARDYLWPPVSKRLFAYAPYAQGEPGAPPGSGPEVPPHAVNGGR